MVSKLANEIFQFLEVSWHFVVAKIRYLKCTLITKKQNPVGFCFFVGTGQFEGLNAARRSKMQTNLAGTFLHKVCYCGIFTIEVNCVASQRKELKYIELKTGYHDDGPAWIGKVMLSKSGRMVYFNDHGFHRCIGISGNYYDVETGEEYWISSVKKNGQDRHWAGKGKICVALNALEDYLSATDSTTLDLKRFFTADIPEIYPIERINEIMNSKLDGE